MALKFVTEISRNVCYAELLLQYSNEYIMPSGGKRKGAGRPKGKGSKVIRVPAEIVPQIEQVIENYKAKLEGREPESLEHFREVLKAKWKVRRRKEIQLEKEQREQRKAERETKKAEKVVAVATALHADAEIAYSELSREQRRAYLKIYGSKDGVLHQMVYGGLDNDSNPPRRSKKKASAKRRKKR